VYGSPDRRRVASTSNSPREIPNRAYAFHDGSVRLIAKSGPLRDLDVAIAVDVDAAAPQACGALHVEYLDEAGVVAQRHQLQRRQQARPEIRRMRRQPDAEFVGQGGDLQIFGDAANLDHGGLRVAYRASRHHLPELMNGAGILAGRNVEPAFGPHLGERCKIFRRPDRLLDEQRRSIAAGMREGDRGLAVQRTVHVDHQRNAGADRLPRGKYRRRGGLVQFDRLVAQSQRHLAFACNQLGLADPQQARIGGNSRAFRSPDQPVQRHALRLGGKIPQRDIERRYREHRDAIATEQMQVALDLFHEGGNICRVGNLEPLRLRRNHFLDGGAGGSRTDIGKGIAPAGDAGIGGNLNHDDFQRRNCRRTLLETRDPGVIGDADMVRPDI
jgi:hypothetical protein